MLPPARELHPPSRLKISGGSCPIRWSCNSTTGSILALETSGQVEVGCRSWHVGNLWPGGSGRDKSSPEDGDHHQNPPSMVEVASSAPAFSVALCRSCSHLQTITLPWISSPMSYPSARTDPSKRLLKPKGCFPFYCRDLGLFPL